MGRRRHCVLCNRAESHVNPLGPHPEGLGPYCIDGCSATTRAGSKSPNVRRRMEYDQAFTWIKARIQHLRRIPLQAATNAERDEEYALIIALSAMKDLSGSFPPDEMIEDEVPVLREI